MRTQSIIARFDGVTKRYGKSLAVDHLDLDLAEGEFVTLLGPSGCGKSTTLRMLGGFETPSQGRILLDGQDVTKLPPNRRDVNMVFQDYALFPHMTVAGNIAFGLELQDRTRAEIEARVADLLDLVQLGGFRDRAPDQLSGGQRQRVALARALARDPKLLLLDEPLGALDAKLRGQVQIELKALQQRTGKTFLFVTHDQEEALTMSDRIVVMNGGRIEQDGTPEELYHQPRSRFVADFIGETNLLACTVRGKDGAEVILDWNGTTLRAAGPVDGRTSVEAALRPESIALSPARPEHANVLEARILRRVFKGSRIDLELDIAGPARLKASADPAAIAGIGDDRVWASWDPARMAILRD
jgi:spermidine/putrescine transport system ATP-binding protein